MRREHTFIGPRRPRCKVGHCDNDAAIRGVCRSCYNVAYQLVTDGTVTWKQLEDAGKVNKVETAKSYFLN